MKIRTVLALLLGSAIPASATTAYMTTTTGDFGTIDLATGVFSLVGASGHVLSGLGEFGNTLYGMALTGDTLYTVDTTTGALSSVGSTGFEQFNSFGSTLTGLYAVNYNAGNLQLYSVDPTTGADTLKGSLGLTAGGNYQLSVNSSTLYFALGADSNNGFASELYTLNTTTGAATLVGPTGGPEVGALLWDGVSTLYGGETFPIGNVITLNTTTGGATFVAGLTGNGTGSFAGFAPLISPSPVPEPGTWSLLAVGGLLMFGWRRRTTR